MKVIQLIVGETASFINLDNVVQISIENNDLTFFYVNGQSNTTVNIPADDCARLVSSIEQFIANDNIFLTISITKITVNEEEK